MRRDDQSLHNAAQRSGAALGLWLLLSACSGAAPLCSGTDAMRVALSRTSQRIVYSACGLVPAESNELVRASVCAR